MQLTAVDRKDIGWERWNAFVMASDQAWFLHHYDYQDTLATWPAWEDAGFALVQGTSPQGELAALLPAHVFSNTSLELMGGPARAPGLGSKQLKALDRHIEEAILSRGQELGLQYVQLRLAPMTPAYRGERCPRVNPLLNFGCTNDLGQTYVIDLRQGLDEVWAHMHGHCRTHIRRAEREGCRVRMAEGSRDLERYYEMHVETYERTGVTPHPFAFFEAIWRNFVGSGEARVFLAERDGHVIAADNEIFFKNAMLGWTAAGVDEASAMGANNLLHWSAMQWAHENGGRWYDSGEGFPAARAGKDKGLNDFKKSFGGELYPAYRGRIQLEQPVRAEPPEPVRAEASPGLLRRLARRLRAWGA